MRIEYDRKADALYLYLASRRQKVHRSREIEPGLLVDLDKKNAVIGIEMLDVSRRLKPAEVFQFSVKHLAEAVKA